MPAQVTQDNCSGCGDCVEACPVEGTIAMQNEKAEVQPESCIDCNACVDACPSDAMKMVD